MTRVSFMSQGCSEPTQMVLQKLPNGNIRIEIKTCCKDLLMALDSESFEVDPLRELFSWEDSKLTEIAQHLPHRASTFLFAALIGLQVEEGLVPAQDVTINISKF